MTGLLGSLCAPDCGPLCMVPLCTHKVVLTACILACRVVVWLQHCSEEAERKRLALEQELADVRLHQAGQEEENRRLKAQAAELGQVRVTCGGGGRQ